MNKFILLAGVVLLASCRDGKRNDEVNSVDTVTMNVITPAKTDSINTNIGSWTATVKSSPKQKNGKITVKGSIPADPKAKVTLSKDKSGKANPGELRLNLSHEPISNSQGNTTNVTYEENLTNVDKYNKVTVLHDNHPVSVIINIERAK